MNLLMCENDKLWVLCDYALAGIFGISSPAAVIRFVNIRRSNMNVL